MLPHMKYRDYFVKLINLWVNFQDLSLMVRYNILNCYNFY